MKLTNAKVFLAIIFFTLTALNFEGDIFNPSYLLLLTCMLPFYIFLNFFTEKLISKTEITAGPISIFSFPILSFLLIAALSYSALHYLTSWYFKTSFQYLIVFKNLTLLLLVLMANISFYILKVKLQDEKTDNALIKHLQNRLLNGERSENDLDPHFVYNTLMPLHYLIKNDSRQAELFSLKLMQIYQHMLQHRNKDLIPLEDELKFIEDYCFLLSIRYKKALVVEYSSLQLHSSFSIIPCTLQLLIENAVKHNFFDVTNKLVISFKIQNNYLIVRNNTRPASEEKWSSKFGLNFLNARYKYLLNKNIFIYSNLDFFIVKIPLIESISNYEVNSHYRG